jgi:hypothetical protein
MKLRLRENSIRLRLLQSEVEKLKTTGSVKEEITFGKLQKLIYHIKISENAKTISAFFEAGEIIVEIPSEPARNWIDSEQISLKAEQFVEDEATLSILIEKDFVCVERPFDEDNKGAFPHPKTKC